MEQPGPETRISTLRDEIAECNRLLDELMGQITRISREIAKLPKYGEKSEAKKRSPLDPHPISPYLRDKAREGQLPKVKVDESWLLPNPENEPR